MLKGETVFVVGAGASKEFNLPTGNELALNISEKLNILYNDWGTEITHGDRDLFLNVAQHPQSADKNPQAWQKAAWLIRDGIILAHSIDDFLDAHRHDGRVVALGKAAIARCILEAEARSTLYFNPNERSIVPGREPTIDMRKCADSWLAGLMRLLGKGTPHADRKKIFDRCTFVIFNYDRCVEHFLSHALQRFYDIPQDEAERIVVKARIFHPYGTVGQLNPHAGAGVRASFGAGRADYYNIGRSAIKTYTESVESDEIRAAVLGADRIVFLGFAFHDQNMGILARDNSIKTKPVIGTAFGMSESDVRVVKQQIGRWTGAGARPSTDDGVDLQSALKATDIFNFYSKTL